MRTSGENATIGRRLAAFLWDYALISGYLVCLVGLSYAAKPLLVPLFAGSPLKAEAVGFAFITLPVFLYFAICEASRAHASWGKRKTGIQVAGSDGGPIGLGRSLGRSALKFAPWELAHFTVWHLTRPSAVPDAVVNGLLIVVYILVFAYLLSPLWSRKRQTIYDRIAGTVVVTHGAPSNRKYKRP
ncbi:RDD family protein [Cohnella zeiphila]|uniref:RDD family protein n=1 Tax=Cohnella zeiphila TaxID=2761120 RepID=A0A7X0SSF2_9BACL|nr:RDD family protein [Cohnella zeiphila]